MIATSHVIIGAASAVAVSQVSHNPLLALAVGVTTHFLCDSLPHLDYPPNSKFIDEEIVWDRSLYTFAIVDSLIALISILTLWVIKDHFYFYSPLAWGALGGYLPDLIDNFPLWKNKLHEINIFAKFHSFHHWIHENWRPHFPMPQNWKIGIISQIVTVLPALYYLLK